jgi:hypothetical protein
MLVRILGEGQFRLPAEALDQVNRLDAEVETALGSADETAFRAALDGLLAKVREVGQPVADDALEESDVVLPFADASPDEVRELLGDGGLLPG